LRYSNFDDEIRLWINGSLVKFAKPATYGGDPNRNVAPIWSAEDPGDLQPIGIGATGVSVRAAHLKVWRDIYYIAGQSDYDEGVDNRVRRVFRSPETWSSERLFRARRQEEYPLDTDQFFPLGDNSPQSADGRLWFPKKYVDRDMLIGKATVVYWPHSWNRPIPFLPNIPKMRLIH
jgi:signal peptidase I